MAEEEEGSRSPPHDDLLPRLGEEVERSGCPSRRSPQEQSPLAGFVGRGPRRSPQRPWAADGPGTPSCIHSWAHFSGPRSEEAMPPRMSAAQAPHRRAEPGFYARVGERGLGKRPQEGWPPGHRRRIQRRPELCSGLRANVAGPFRAPVMGLERP